MVQTSDALGLSGILAGAGYSIGQLAQVGLLYGRMQVRDLVRTTTSPTSVGGDIPVYEQFLGANLGVRLDRFQAGLTVAFHDQRFDVLDENGVTLDAGVRVAVHRHLNLAAATHFFPVDFSRQETTDYYLGAEIVAGDSVPFAGSVARVVLQLGTTYRGSEDWEYTIAGALTVARVVRVETAVTSEAAYGERFLRLGVGVSLFIGRYGIGLAAGSGQNDVGGTYRVGIDAQLVQ
jgi:hypothetical protein